MSFYKKIITALFLFFIIFLFCRKPVGEIIEERKRTEIEEICAEINDKNDRLSELKIAFEGYETFSPGGISSLSALINEDLDFVTGAEKKLKRKQAPEDIKTFEDQCKTELLALKTGLEKAKPDFDYLIEIYPIYKDLKDSLREAEEKKYQGFTEQGRRIKEFQSKFEQDLNGFIQLAPPLHFKESHLYLKKTLSGVIDFWTNAEVAVARKTPYIFNYALWVSQSDWEQMEKVMAREFSFSL